jgi:hypothetical protein
MNLRSVLTGLGVGITTAVVATTLIIELLAMEFSALIGLLVGVLSGAFLGGVVVRRHGEFSRGLRWFVASLAGFGYGLIFALGMICVNLVSLTFDDTVAVGVGVALVLGLAAMLADRGN